MSLIINAGAQSSPEEAKEYGNNLITIAPMTLYGAEYVGDIGLGISYERFIDDKVSLVSPLSAGMVNRMLQAGLGVKFYPTGHESIVKYSVSPMFMLTRIDYDSYYGPYYFDNYYEPLPQEALQFGFMLVNGLNVTIDQDIFLGVEGGFGVNYISRVESSWNDGHYNEDPSVNGMLRLNFGYRFWVPSQLSHTFTASVGGGSDKSPN